MPGFFAETPLNRATIDEDAQRAATGIYVGTGPKPFAWTCVDCGATFETPHCPDLCIRCEAPEVGGRCCAGLIVRAPRSWQP